MRKKPYSDRSSNLLTGKQSVYDDASSFNRLEIIAYCFQLLPDGACNNWQLLDGALFICYMKHLVAVALNECKLNRVKITFSFWFVFYPECMGVNKVTHSFNLELIYSVLTSHVCNLRKCGKFFDHSVLKYCASVS